MMGAFLGKAARIDRPNLGHTPVLQKCGDYFS
jgi:hypothetical protein